MRKHATMLFAAAIAVALIQAQRPARAAFMTGERLIEKLTPVDPATITPNPESVLSKASLAEYRTHTNREFFEAYVAAVSDTTEGKAWCANQRAQVPKPDTLWDESRYGLQRLSAVQLKRNASELLVEIWSARWPCAAGRGQK